MRLQRILFPLIVAFLALGVGVLFIIRHYQHRNDIVVPTPDNALFTTNATVSGANVPAVVMPPDSPQYLLTLAFRLMELKQFDAALDKLNLVIQTSPTNPQAFGLRGAVYTEKKLWDKATKDYQTALALGGKNAQLEFNLAEIDFLQKKYDAARPGFAALEDDPEVGDLAAYKTFLCDLFGGHEDEASRELDVFDQVGMHASYYFANASWSLYHQKPDEARGWLVSAANIYSPAKFRLYEASLVSLGYIPLPPALAP